MISALDMSTLPPPAELRRITQSLAVLDAIVSPEWEYRYYSFNALWADGEEMASMRNGQGDHWFALFTAAGVAIHGLAHEAPMFVPGKPRSGVFDELPIEFKTNFLEEPAFDTQNSTFCIWRRVADTSWQRGSTSFLPAEAADGSRELLTILAGQPDQYVDFAAEYYEVELPHSAVKMVYDHARLSDELVRALNPDVTLQSVEGDLRQIGYPAG